MRPRTTKRLRIAVVFVVAALMAVIAGSAVALAQDLPGHPDGSAEVCFFDQFQHIDQESGAGDYHQDYDVGGQTVTVWFEWTADKHLTVWAVGGYFTVIRIKAGSSEVIETNTAGPIEAYFENPGQADEGNALSHLDFCLIANPDVGSLRITKTITGDNPGTLGYSDFEITVTGPGGYLWTGNFDGSGEILLEGLEPGTYNITEAPPGYPFSVSGEGGVTVSVGQQTGVTITNTGSTTTTLPDPGSLRITKSITGDNPDSLVWADFEITVTGPGGYSWTGNFNGSGEIVLTGLAPGTYTIDESEPGYPFTVTGEGSVTVDSNQQTGVTIINTGSTTTSTTEPHCGLEIIKSIEGDNPGNLDWENFFVTVDGPGGYHWYGHFDATTGMIVLTDLEPGVYTVSEDDPGYPFTVTGEGGVTVVSGQTGIVTITNTGSTTTTLPRLGSLLITKSIEGDNPGGLDFEDFEISVSGPNDYEWSGPFDSTGHILLTSLQPGTYTVSEDDPGYPFTVSGEGGVEVAYGQQAGLTITNSGSTTTTTEESTTSTTQESTTSTTQESTTSTTQESTTSTTQASTTTTDPGTSTTEFGWVYEPDDIQTGFGGTADGSNWAFIVLVFSSTLLVSVLVAAGLGVRAGVL